MRKVAAVALVVLGLVILTPAPAAAQEGQFDAAFSGVTWGYDYGNGFRLGYGRRFHTNEDGGAPRTATSVFGDLSVHFFDFERDMFVTGGVREHFMLDRRYHPFVHGFAGIIHWSEKGMGGQSGTDPVFGGGAGLDYKVTEKFDLRFQYDLIFERDTNNWDRVHRISFGGVWNLGNR